MSCLGCLGMVRVNMSEVTKRQQGNCCRASPFSIVGVYIKEGINPFRILFDVSCGSGVWFSTRRRVVGGLSFAVFWLPFPSCY